MWVFQRRLTFLNKNVSKKKILMENEPGTVEELIAVEGALLVLDPVLICSEVSTWDELVPSVMPTLAVCESSQVRRIIDFLE